MENNYKRYRSWRLIIGNAVRKKVMSGKKRRRKDDSKANIIDIDRNKKKRTITIIVVGDVGACPHT